MKQFSLKLIGVMSWLLIWANLPALAQNEINKKPLQDFAGGLNQKLESKEVDLNKPFSVTLEGYLTKNGKFDAKRSKFTKQEGDKEMIAVAKSAIEAVGDSGILIYLQQLGVEKVKINFSQDEKDVAFIITSELPTPAKAKTIASGFNTLFRISKDNVKEDEVKSLLNATKISSQDKNFILNFAMPKEEAHKLLNQELQKQKQKSYSSKVN